MDVAKERISFEIELDSEYRDSAPHVIIGIDGTTHFTGHIDRHQIIRFYHDLDFGQDHRLTISRSHTQPCQLLTIQTITIDGTNIQNLIWNRSQFRPSYPEPWASQQRDQGIDLAPQIIGETCLGHDGEWSLTFGSPFWQFLLNDIER